MTQSLDNCRQLPVTPSGDDSIRRGYDLFEFVEILEAFYRALE
jgi:hypothetical protein